MFKKKTDKNEKIKEKARKEEARATAMYEDYESKKNSSEPKEVKGLLRSVPVILCAVALFIILCFITGETGAFGEFISSTLKGLFSYVAYTIPAFIVVHAIFFISDLERKKLLQRLAVSLILLVTLAELQARPIPQRRCHRDGTTTLYRSFYRWAHLLECQNQ